MHGFQLILMMTTVSIVYRMIQSTPTLQYFFFFIVFFLLYCRTVCTTMVRPKGVWRTDFFILRIRNPQITSFFEKNRDLYLQSKIRSIILSIYSHTVCSQDFF